MDLQYGAEAETFRKQVREFLTAHWAPQNVAREEMRAFIKSFRRNATDAGFLYRSIARQYGGSEQPVDVIRAQVIREEFAPRRRGQIG